MTYVTECRETLPQLRRDRCGSAPSQVASLVALRERRQPLSQCASHRGVLVVDVPLFEGVSLEVVAGQAA